VFFQILTYRKEDHVGMIGFVHPEIQRIEAARLSDELVELCDEIAWDEEVRVILITIPGENVLPLDKGTRGFPLAEPVGKLRQPVIAAIEGDAIGQGFELALACDIRIATELSAFRLPQIAWGVIPWDGGTQRLARLVGRGKALEMVLTGEKVDPQEAHRIGLVSKIVAPDQLMNEAMKLAIEMAAKSPIALRFSKEAIHKGMDLTLQQGLGLEADLYLLIHTTKDRTEGIKAFQEKRKAKFEGK
jgi:enoyl-CoA hydratase/carnithine racemase